MRRGVIALILLLLLTSCAAGTDEDTVVVLAAASLTDAFTEIEVAFERENPTLDVQVSVAGSATLREQILEGAPADVFASANDTTMQVLLDAGAVDDPVVFATNELTLAVPAGNPSRVTSIDDMANSALLVGLCAVGVPCGDFARQALEQVGVEANVDTNERDVRSLVTKLAADELDVGLVYVTDVQANPGIDAVALPSQVDVPISYPVAQLVESTNRAGGASFVTFVQSAEGQAILASHGFGTP